MPDQKGRPGEDLLGGPWTDTAQEQCGFQDEDRTVFLLAVSDGTFDMAKITGRGVIWAWLTFPQPSAWEQMGRSCKGWRLDKREQEAYPQGTASAVQACGKARPVMRPDICMCM